MAFSVALQLYSIRSIGKVDFKAALAEAKRMGYDAVELAGLYGNKAEDVKQMCEELGITPISAHVPYRDMVANPDLLEDYATLGCKFVVIPYLCEEDRPGTDGFAAVIENAKMLGARAKALGMQLLYHNHDFEFVKIDGKYALDILYDEVPADYLATELDTCWVRVGGEDPAKYVEKYSGRAPIVHLKDYVGGKTDSMYELIGIDKKASADEKKFEFRPVGSGVQDFPSILAASERAGAQWVVVEQDAPTEGMTDVECAAQSRAYLKTLGY